MTVVWFLVLGAGISTARLNFQWGLVMGSVPLAFIFCVSDAAKTFLPSFLGSFLGERWVGTMPRKAAGWMIYGFLVVLSLICALGMQAITSNQKIAGVKAQQTTYADLKADRERRETRIAELSKETPKETLTGQIEARERDRVYTRTGGCSKAGTEREDSRAFCADLDKLRSQERISRANADIQSELSAARADLARIEAALSKTDTQAVHSNPTAHLEALARLTRTDVDTVDTVIRVLVAILTEIMGIFPWMLGSHDAPRKAREARTGRFAAKATSPHDMTPTAPERLECTGMTGTVADWVRERVQKTGGITTSAKDLRADYEGYCQRLNVKAIDKTRFGKEMTALGLGARQKIKSEQHYVGLELVPRVKLAVVQGGASS